MDNAVSDWTTKNLEGLTIGIVADQAWEIAGVRSDSTASVACSVLVCTVDTTEFGAISVEAEAGIFPSATDADTTLFRGSEERVHVEEW